MHTKAYLFLIPRIDRTGSTSAGNSESTFTHLAYSVSGGSSFDHRSMHGRDPANATMVSSTPFKRLGDLLYLRSGAILFGLVVALLAVMCVSSGCTSPGPCLEYRTLAQQKMTSMYGAGYVVYTEEALVCSRRGPV
ncbi:MAG: hypothetical protein AAGI88_17995 [Pseudomonadota bacterium]